MVIPRNLTPTLPISTRNYPPNLELRTIEVRRVYGAVVMVILLRTELRLLTISVRLEHPHGRRRNRHGPKWHKDYSEIDTYGGRVLIIDFVKEGVCPTLGAKSIRSMLNNGAIKQQTKVRRASEKSQRKKSTISKACAECTLIPNETTKPCSEYSTSKTQNGRRTFC